MSCSTTTDTATTTATTTTSTILVEEKSLHESDDGHGNLKPSCGESEILRNRLLFPGGGNSRPNTPPYSNCNSENALSLAAFCNNSIKNSFRAMASSSNSSGVGNNDGESKAGILTSTGEAVDKSVYPKCRDPVIVGPQSLLKPKIEPETVEVKPDIASLGFGVDTSIPSSSVIVPSTSKINPASVPVKIEPVAVKIPYDRERILNFLTDYWKSKNAQDNSSAQQQTAADASAPVNVADFRSEPKKIVEEALFDLFVEKPMIIDGLPINKRAWAKAFYERDIIQTSKVLFEAIFSEAEMQQCTLNGKKGTPELSAVKMLAVLRAGAWMKNKKQDPYSFDTNIPSHNQFPSNEEREKIEKKVFTERRSQANRKITKTGGNGENAGESSSAAVIDESNVIEPLNQKENSSPTHSSSSSITPEEEEQDNLLAPPLTKIPKLDLDSEVLKQLQILYAENPEGLISYLLPEARSILIDGFLIPHEDWAKAFEEASVDHIKSAWTLFKVLFSKTEILNCTLNGKNGTPELDFVKRLAILRAVTWMKENQGTTVDIYAFNVRRPECNCFPSDEDKDKIETKVFTEKRYQACRKLKEQHV